MVMMMMRRAENGSVSAIMVLAFSSGLSKVGGLLQ